MPTIASYALTSVADVKTNLDITTSTWDNLFVTLINAATDWIEKYCGGRRFVGSGVDVTEYYESVFDVDGPADRSQQWLSVKSWPIISVTSLSFRTGINTYSLQPTQNYDVYTDTGQIFFRVGFPRGPQSVQLIYQGGYASNAIPNDLAYACIKIVSKEFFRRKAEGKVMERSGGNQVQWSEGLDAEVVDLLSAYRRMPL